MGTGYYEVESNSPEELEQLAKEGWYPGKEYMERRAIAIKVPIEIIPKIKRYGKESMLVEAYPVIIKDLGIEGIIEDEKNMLLILNHKSLKPLKEGRPVPVVAEAKKK